MQNKDIPDYCIDQLIKAGADKAQCIYSSGEKKELNVDAGEFSLFRTNANHGISMMAIKDQKKGSLSINKINKDDIDGFVRPMSVEDGAAVVDANFREAGALGDPVLSNEAGELYGEFHLPARTFFVGQNDLGITNQPAPAARFSTANYSSHAVGQFNAFNHGVDKESVDLTTKKVEYYRDRVVTGFAPLNAAAVSQP